MFVDSADSSAKTLTQETLIKTSPTQAPFKEYGSANSTPQHGSIVDRSALLTRALPLLAAVIFGVHPIHTEIVNSIFNRSELLVSIGVVGVLWWFLKNFRQTPGRAWFGLSVVYLLILFCRENAVVLPALAVATLAFTLPGSWLQ